MPQDERVTFVRWRAEPRALAPLVQTCLLRVELIERRAGGRFRMELRGSMRHVVAHLDDVSMEVAVPMMALRGLRRNSARQQTFRY
jgi:hypothetical protein